MATSQDHYDRLLGPIYTWMLGEWPQALASARAELEALQVPMSPGALAVDLGTGSGASAVALAEQGCEVLAVDNCEGLLDELDRRRGDLPIKTLCSDLPGFASELARPAQLVLCLGDTLTHLESPERVAELFAVVARTLAPGGQFLITLRDYTRPALQGTARFIPVRSDADRILTCFLEYGDDIVTVHDLLQLRQGDGWQLQVSSYPKLRLRPAWLCEVLQDLGLQTELGLAGRGMALIRATAAGA
ncbi:MAG: methyltransferase domain-containing protein [Deltaproteobacteria bacterium]|nr:methyltransferase domain-containing protein [Deltaproteobacteria bacterium]